MDGVDILGIDRNVEMFDGDVVWEIIHTLNFMLSHKFEY